MLASRNAIGSTTRSIENARNSRHVGLRARCEASRRLLAKGPGFVLYALMDFVVNQFVETLEEQVVELEASARN